MALLREVRDRQSTENPYTSDEYHEFCKKHNFNEASYQSVLSTLRNCGLLAKSGGHHVGRYDINYAFVLELLIELYEFLGAKQKKSKEF